MIKVENMDLSSVVPNEVTARDPQRMSFKSAKSATTYDPQSIVGDTDRDIRENVELIDKNEKKRSKSKKRKRDTDTKPRKKK